MTNSSKSVQSTTSNTLLKFESTYSKRQYSVDVSKYEYDQRSQLVIEYSLYNSKGKPVTDVSEILDRAIWQDVQFEMKAREQANRIF